MSNLTCKLRRIRAAIHYGWDSTQFTGHKYHQTLRINDIQVDQCESCKTLMTIQYLDGSGDETHN